MKNLNRIFLSLGTLFSTTIHDWLAIRNISMTVVLTHFINSRSCFWDKRAYFTSMHFSSFFKVSTCKWHFMVIFKYHHGFRSNQPIFPNQNIHQMYEHQHFHEWQGWLGFLGARQCKWNKPKWHNPFILSEKVTWKCKSISWQDLEILSLLFTNIWI